MAGALVLYLGNGQYYKKLKRLQKAKEYAAKLSCNNIIITVIFNLITILLACHLVFGHTLYKHTHPMPL